MINKIFKNIHIKSFKISKFVSYLMYILLLFLFAFFIFLLIPKFLDHQKKSIAINEYLIKNYNLKLKDFSSIEYNILPYPNLILKNVNFKINKQPIEFFSKKMRIFLNFENIYNKKIINSNKLFMDNLKISLNINNSNELIDYFKKLEKKFYFKRGFINFLKDKKTLFQVENLDYSNFGFKKNQFKGSLFDKNFKISIKGKNEDVLFEILNTGVKAIFKFDKINSDEYVSGSSRINVLNNFLKFDFKSSEGIITIKNSIFKNENLLISSIGKIKFDPFFYINSNIEIIEMNEDFFYKIDLKRLFLYKEIIKKINGNNKISFKEKKIMKKFISSIYLNLESANGRVDYLSEIEILGGKILCKGDSLLTEDYPRLSFNCKFNIIDSNKIYKKFSLPKKFKDNAYVLDISGDFNLLNEKVDFKLIKVEDVYSASNEDLKFFSKVFEKLLFNENFINIFKFEKIRNFLIEVI